MQVSWPSHHPKILAISQNCVLFGFLFRPNEYRNTWGHNSTSRLAGLAPLSATPEVKTPGDGRSWTRIARPPGKPTAGTWKWWFSKGISFSRGFIFRFQNFRKTTLQEQSSKQTPRTNHFLDDTNILAAVPAPVRAEFGPPSTCPVYARDTWIQPESEHIKQLTMVFVFSAQAASWSFGWPPSHQGTHARSARAAGILQRVWEHSRCPAAINIEANKSLLTELKKDEVLPEVLAQQEMLRHFLAGSTTRLLKMAADVAQNKKEPTAGILIRSSYTCPRRPVNGLSGQVCQQTPGMYKTL